LSSLEKGVGIFYNGKTYGKIYILDFSNKLVV
jgi:hypothetical protein